MNNKKMIFLSNYLTPHQIPFCEEMDSLTNKKYLFIETEDRDICNHIGWKSDVFPDYAVTNYAFQQDFEKYQNEINNADVVIIGSAPDKYMVQRLKMSGLTFKYSERFYKKGFEFKKLLRNALASWLHHGRFQKYPFYMLCASAYTAADCAKFNNYKGKCYKWGYFPELKCYDSIQELVCKKNPTNLLWAGRLIDWKHPELAVEIAKKLKSNKKEFHLDIIGEGPMRATLTELIKSNHLEDVITLHGAMPPRVVRKFMEKSGIFIFTSDFNEGWGAVANEAMNSGCAIVASHAIGSVPYLVKDGENGLIYQDGNFNDLYKKVEFLLENLNVQQEMGILAYETITKTWNSVVAAERIEKLSQAILQGQKKPDLFADGPCSRAEILKNDWYSSKVKE